jgi:hypothetical protein
VAPLLRERKLAKILNFPPQLRRFAMLWKNWLKIGRLVPLVTAGVGVVAGAMSLLDYVQLSLTEDLIISLLALLAIDALVERLSLLEQINEKLELLPRPQNLNEPPQPARTFVKAQNQSHAILSTKNEQPYVEGDHLFKSEVNEEKHNTGLSEDKPVSRVVIVEIKKDGERMMLEIR